MKELAQPDPLATALTLLDCITGRNGAAESIEELAKHIDAFMYSVHSLRPVSYTHLTLPTNREV